MWPADARHFPAPVAGLAGICLTEAQNHQVLKKIVAPFRPESTVEGCNGTPLGSSGNPAAKFVCHFAAGGAGAAGLAGAAGIVAAGGDWKSFRAFFQSCSTPHAQGTPTNNHANKTSTTGVLLL
jgi:hypothetical protein